MIAGLTGCTTIYPAPSPPDPKVAPELYAPPLEPEYRIRVGDRLAVRSYHDPQFNQEVWVRPDGRISVLLVGEIQVIGMTPQALNTLISEKYRNSIGDGDVTLIVQQLSDTNVFVGGEVKSPAVLPVTGSLSLMQALMATGGLLATADQNQVLVFRQQDDGKIMMSKVDIDRVLMNELPDLYLRRRDIIYVPKSGIAKVGDYVDLYINRLIPRSVLLQFGFLKALDGGATVSVPVVTTPGR